MLETDDRVLLRELIRPPHGYEFDQAIITTYSLDLLSLLMVPLHFTLFEHEASDGQPMLDPLAMLSALQKHSDRLTIFCQAGQIAVPAQQRRLYGYLEASVIEAKSPRGGAFHSKVWVLRYTSGDAVMYRVGVFSRNLTMDRCWDTAVMLEGELQDRKVGYAVNRPLSEFVAALPEMALRAVSATASERARNMADEVRKVKFSIPAPFDEFTFYAVGVPGGPSSSLKIAGTKAIVVSPFLSDKVLERIAGAFREATLVSRARSLDLIEPSLLQRFDQVKVLSDAVSSEQMADASDGTSGLSGLHAKLIVFQGSFGGSLITGSANATIAAERRNVEFLVELLGKRTTCGVDALLQPEEGVSKLISLLQDYVSPEGAPFAENVAEQLDRALDEGACLIADELTGLTARMVEDDSWTVQIAARAGAALPGSIAGASCRLISLGSGSSQRLDLGSPVAAVFDSVSVAALTSFLAVELKAEAEGVTRSKQFVLNLPLTGGPEDRIGRIVRDILRDRQSVIRFLLLLLGDYESLLTGISEGEDGPGNEPSRTSPDLQVLLEPMLRALHRDPARLDQVRKVMEHLDGPEGESALPEGWMDIWPAIWKAREGVKA